MRPTRLYYERDLRGTPISLNYDRTYDGGFVVIVADVHIRKGHWFEINEASIFLDTEEKSAWDQRQ